MPPFMLNNVVAEISTASYCVQAARTPVVTVQVTILHPAPSIFQSKFVKTGGADRATNSSNSTELGEV